MHAKKVELTANAMEQLAALVVDQLLTKLQSQTATAPRLVGVVELAKMLGMHPNTIHKYRKSGLFPSVRVGQRVFFDPDAVIEKLNGKEATSENEKRPAP